SSERLMCALVGEPSPLLSAFPLAWSKPSDSSGKRQSLSALVEAATTDCNSKDTGRGRIHRQKRVSSSTDAPHGPKRMTRRRLGSTSSAISRGTVPTSAPREKIQLAGP